LKKGTDESLDFLRLIESADDDALLNSSLGNFIEYKWKKQRTKIKIQSSIYILYFIIHSAYVIAYFDNKRILWVLLGYNILILGYEII